MTGVVWDDEVMCRLLKAFVGTEKEGIGKAYGGRFDWVPDSDESDSGSSDGSLTYDLTDVTN